MNVHRYPTISVVIFISTLPLVLVAFHRTAVRHKEVFTLTILHTNDVHSRFMPFNNKRGRCSAADVATNRCYGGSAKLATAIQRVRQQEKNVLLLDAGDQSQGSVWYSILKHVPVADVMNKLRYDAMTFGNHEFDDGPEAVAQFVKALTFPVVSSNIDATGSPLEGIFVDSLILYSQNRTVGIVGYTTPSTAWLSKAGNEVVFRDEISSLQRAVSKLKSNGVDIVIVLGHSGILQDRLMCQKVADVDVVVGGHTHTFLYTGETPSIETPEGPYPEVYTTSKGKCLVVTDFAFGKYLGYLQVGFDIQNKAVYFKGNPILLDNDVDEDAEVQRLLKPYAERVEQFENETIGWTAMDIDGVRESCRLKECNLGNVVADAAVYAYVVRHTNRTTSWTDSAVAIVNSGAIRGFEKGAGQNISVGDLFSAMPFDDTFSLVKLSGATVQAAFEHSVRDYNPVDPPGKFLQVSGIKVVYDLSKPNGHRVKVLSLLCSNCTIATYEPLLENATYNIIASTYLIKGGDGYKVIKRGALHTDNLDLAGMDMLTQYVRARQPLMTGKQSRILFATDKEYGYSCD